MPKKLVSTIMLAVIILGVSMLAFSVRPSRASGVVGDVNGDGKVDGSDLAQVGRAFGSYLGHPRWDSATDLNGDGIVNSLDVAIVAKNFGMSA